MFRESLEYPTRGNDLGRKYLIGTLLGLGAFLIVPAFVLAGYLVKVIRESVEGAEQIPAFDDYTELFVDGLKAAGIMLTYLLGAVAVIAGLDSLGQATGTTALMDLLGFTVLLLSLYLLPSAITEFARNNSMRAAFRKKVVDLAFTRRYVKGSLVLLAASILIGIAQAVIVMFLIFSIIGIPAIIVLIPAMTFYENLVYFRIFARMTEESTD